VGGPSLCACRVQAVRRGFATWPALLWDAGETCDGTTTASSPPWRRVWLWALVSFVVLGAGLALGAMGTAAVLAH
jgi:hypothetical protein